MGYSVKSQVPKKTYTPIGCLVALYMYAQGETAGGVVLPEGVQDPSESVRCLVIAVGPDCKWVKEGDEVILGNSPPLACSHAGQKTLLTREDNLAGIIDEEYRTRKRAVKQEAA